MSPRISPLEVVIVTALGFGCAPESPPEPAPTPASRESSSAGQRQDTRRASTESAKDAELDSNQHAAKGAGDQPGGACELLEHRSSCTFESVTFAASPMDGELTAIAAYTSPDPAAPRPLELHSRVYESQRADFEAHLREHAIVPCRWSTLAKGSCGTPPPEIVVPAFEP